jgi:hypothetical protein
MSELGDIITSPTGQLHTVIGENETGHLVTVIRRGEKCDIFIDFELTDRDGSPPHWTASRPRVAQRVCVECGGRWYASGYCKRHHALMGGRLRSEGQRRRQANGRYVKVTA